MCWRQQTDLWKKSLSKEASEKQIVGCSEEMLGSPSVAASILWVFQDGTLALHASIISETSQYQWEAETSLCWAGYVCFAPSLMIIWKL